MLNIRGTLSWMLGVLLIISITSVAFGQQEPKAESELSESETIKIIREIHQLEKDMIKEIYKLDKEMREHVENEIGGVNKNLSDMNRELGSLQASMTFIKWVLATIAIPVALYILSVTFPGLLFWRKKEKVFSPEGIPETSAHPLAEDEMSNQRIQQGNA